MIIVISILLTYLACGLVAARRVYVKESANFRPYFSEWKAEHVTKPEDMVIWPWVFTGPALLIFWSAKFLFNNMLFRGIWLRTIKAETPAMRKEREEARKAREEADYQKNLAIINNKPKEIAKELDPITKCTDCGSAMIVHWSDMCNDCRAKYPNCGHAEWERFPD